MTLTQIKTIIVMLFVCVLIGFSHKNDLNVLEFYWTKNLGNPFLFLEVLLFFL